RRHTRFSRDWSSDVCSSDLIISQIKTQTLDVYSILNEFVLYLDKQGYRASTIRVWLAAVKGFLRHLGAKIYSEDCRHNIRIPKRSEERRVGKEYRIKRWRDA